MRILSSKKSIEKKREKKRERKKSSIRREIIFKNVTELNI
jgi:hypothetical protein